MCGLKGAVNEDAGWRQVVKGPIREVELRSHTLEIGIII